MNLIWGPLDLDVGPYVRIFWCSQIDEAPQTKGPLPVTRPEDPATASASKDRPLLSFLGAFGASRSWPLASRLWALPPVFFSCFGPARKLNKKKNTAWFDGSGRCPSLAPKDLNPGITDA